MKKLKHHVHFGDLLAIATTLFIGVYSINQGMAALGALYISFSFLRFFLIILQLIIVHKYDDDTKKFKKERLISRLMGLIMLLEYGGIVGAVLTHFYDQVPETFYTKHALNLAIIYAIFTAYKFLSAYINLKRSKKSFSPYRETVSRITYMVAFINLIPLSYFVTSLIEFPESMKEFPQAITTIVVLATGAVILLIALGMIISRRLPKELRPPKKEKVVDVPQETNQNS